MLIIREEQMQVFEVVALRTFEEQMVQHLKEFAPRHSEVITEPGVRQVVRLGIERAAEYGLTNRGPVRFYIELMYMFGSDFDTDPQLPWAGEALGEAGPPDQMLRAEQLYGRAMSYAEAVVGPEYEFEKEVLSRASRLRLEDLPRPGGNFREEAVRGLKALYPQKCEYMGEPRLRLLVQRGVEMADAHMVSGGAGDALLVGLMFGFGHGCLTDPQFPWIQSALSNEAAHDPAEKVRRLHAKLKIYLERAVINLERR